jgi:hypothetical protein
VGINNPENRTLRRQIMSFGTSETCKEMLSRNAPLKLAEDAPVIGRFFPRNCVHQELPNGNIVLQFDGEGYAWTNVSRKLTFVTGARIEYAPDFRCSSDDAIYAYFPTRNVERSQFNLRQLEVSSVAGGFLSGWVNPVAETFGRQLFVGKLGEGFTVIRDTNQDIEFGMGIIPVGQHPTKPFRLSTDARRTYENARVDVHQNQRDFVGPIVVRDSGQALYLTASVDGTPAVDLFVFARDEADPAMRAYIDSVQAAPMPPSRTLNDVVVAGRPYRRTVPVKAGTYYVVFDNTRTAGPTMPPTHLLDDRAATVSYAIQVGDAP